MSTPLPERPETDRSSGAGNPPRPLVVAAVVVAGEALLLFGLAVVELFSMDPARMTLGLTTSAFFAVYGAALAVSAGGLARARRWSRGPVVLTQLIQLGVAWSFARGSTLAIAVGLGCAALVVLVAILLPSATAALTGATD